MAWWNQPEGSVTPTVTLRRLAAWLAERGYSYDIDLSEGLVRSSVLGLDYVLMVVDGRILVVRANHQLDQLSGPVLGAEELSRVRTVAQEVSSGRLIPALYTEVDDAGLNLCAETLTNVGAGLDDAQLAGTMDFVLEGTHEALREVLGLLDSRIDTDADTDAETGEEADADAETGVPPEAERARTRTGSQADGRTAGEGALAVEPYAGATDEVAEDATVIALPEATATREMAVIIDGPGTDARAQSQAEVRAEPTLDVKSDESMPSLGDADDRTGVETTDTPAPLLVS